MSQLKGYYSRIVVEKSLISVAEFLCHLCECLNVPETYVFFPTPHYRRTYAVFNGNYTIFKGTDKSNEMATE